MALAKEPKLPDIKGTWNSVSQSKADPTGAIRKINTWNTHIVSTGENDSWGQYFTFAASSYNSIYNGTDVQMAAISLIPQIKI